jgi:ACT domain-containing protein
MNNRWILVQVSMKLEMKDTPGQLVAALKPISEVGGNIIAVIHQHDQKHEGGVLAVQIVLELPEQRISDLLALIRAQGVNVVRIGKERLLYKQTVIMIGHIMHTDLGDTVDRIDCTGFAEVTELNMVMPAISEPSSARMVIRSVNRNDMEQALGILRGVAREKNLLIIEPLEEIG